MTEIFRWTATEMRAALGRREVSARELTQAALQRMDAMNPELNAVVSRFDDEALAEADALDAAIRDGEQPGPLAGVPVTIKVNVDQRGHATTNGIRLQKDLLADTDSPVVANLRKAGAVIVGRTNTPAFSLRWFTRNRLHGETLNPRNPALTPGGSSGGAGASVAAGMVPLAHGTDIAGSIRYPAYACGIHGLRPSLGRVPAFNFTGPDRMIGAQLMAVSGPLARSVPDLGLALGAMAARDTRDPWWVPAPFHGPEYRRRAALCTEPEGLKVDPAVQAALRGAAARLRDAGWTVDEVDEIPPLREAAAMQLRLWLAELRRSGGALEKEGDPDALFVAEQIGRHSPPIDLDGLMDTLQDRSRLTRLWRAFFEAWPLLICPVSGELPFANHRDVASPEDFDAVLEAQLLQVGLPFMGLPGMTLTTSLDGPAPVGVQLTASHLREDILLAAGEAIADTVPAVA